MHCHALFEKLFLKLWNCNFLAFLYVLFQSDIVIRHTWICDYIEPGQYKSLLVIIIVSCYFN